MSLIKDKVLSFYFAYYFLIGLYIIFLRLNSVPNTITEFLYGISIIIAIVALAKNGFLSLTKRIDSLMLIIFFVYYIVSSIIYSAYEGGSDSSWLIKDWLYSLLPILFYILIRHTKLIINYQLVLKITLFSIAVYDVIAMMMLFFPGSSLERMFSQEMIVRESVAYALFGLLGTILGGFTNVIALIICVFSPISLRSIYKIILSVLFIICIFLTGQRTPIGGIAIIIIISLFTQKGKSRFFLLLSFILLAILFANINVEVEGFDVKNAMTERYVERFNIFTSGSETRGNQWQVFVMDNPFSFIIGDGVGKYSIVNPNSTLPMPDAMLYRIFNEMGLIGITTYLIFFILNLIKAIKRKNGFMLALILYVFIANYFNRVLFTAPLSIIPYFLIAYFNWHNIQEKS